MPHDYFARTTSCIIAAMLAAMTANAQAFDRTLPVGSKQYSSADSTKMVIPSTTSTTSTGSHKVEIKNPRMKTGNWTSYNIANENYKNLGPGGGPTPSCPVNSSQCPDMNGMLGGVKVAESVVASQCPEVCMVSRSGDLDGDTMPVCPSGYAQMAAFDVQDEWVPNPDYGGGSGAGVAVKTTDYDTFKSYWTNPDSYHCVSEYVGYGNWICFPYQGSVGWGNDWTASDAYDVVFRDQGYTKPSWGMNNNSDQPYRMLNPASPAFAGWTASQYHSYHSNYEAAAGVKSRFDHIRNVDKMMPSTWAYFDNTGYYIPRTWAIASWWFFYPEHAVSANYEPAITAETKKMCFYGYCVPAKTKYGMKTYIDSSCNVEAKIKAVCGINHTGYQKDYHAQGVTSAGNGKCAKLFVKLQIPVFKMYCKSKPKKLKASGYKVPTSLLCGRIKSEWN